MSYIIESGTDVRVHKQRYPSAEAALDAALDLISARRPNVRIKDAHERHVPLGDLWRLAGQAAVGSRRSIKLPATTFG